MKDIIFGKRTLVYDDFEEIQDYLNELTINDWKNVLTKDHYKVAMIEEFAEVLDTVPWKWWKAQSRPNMDQLKLELVDVLHFALSANILINDDFEDYRGITLGADDETRDDCRCLLNEDNQLDHRCFISFVTLLMNEVKGPMDLKQMFESVGVSSEEVSAYYVAKATLNAIRQDKGYKLHGKKTVAGKEDNYHLEDIIEAFRINPTMRLDDIHQMVIDHLS